MDVDNLLNALMRATLVALIDWLRDWHRRHKGR